MLEYIEGKLYRKLKNRRKLTGTRTSKGYIRLKVAGRFIMAHRYIWEMFKGPVPKGLLIDHINRDRDDNRIENLRLVTPQENAFNSGARGTYHVKSSNKWRAYITIDGHKKHLGYFDTETKARQAYLESKRVLHHIG